MVNSNIIPLRRSARLTDHFKKLPNEVILTILTKIQDTKTLIRCYSVCKQFCFLVSLIDSILLRVSYADEADVSYTPLTAIPNLMKIFANLKFLKIKQTPCQELSERYFFKMKVVIDNGIHIQFCVTFWIGEFTVQDGQRVHVLMSSLRVRESAKVVDIEITYFLSEILPHCPKTLKSLVVSSAEMPEFRSEVNAFVTKEKALELTKLMFYMPAIRGWFNDTKNVVYWFKYPSFEKYRLKYPDNNRPFVKDMWLVQKCELRRSKYTEGDFTSAQFDLPSVTETDIKELLCACEEDGGRGDGRGDYENEQQ